MAVLDASSKTGADEDTIPPQDQAAGGSSQPKALSQSNVLNGSLHAPSPPDQSPSPTSEPASSRHTQRRPQSSALRPTTSRQDEPASNLNPRPIAQGIAESP